ncbi:MAG: hypothetical protein J5524_06555 [Bacteroidaceae bacterium]|nr:hypothetical protein [Bacteroidaceae bacterium]
MKKIYKSPELLVVKLSSERELLQSSYVISSEQAEDAGWTKEYNNSSISNQNVWDEEW